MPNRINPAGATMRWIILVSVAVLSAASVATSDDRAAQQIDADVTAAKAITEITLTRSGNNDGPADTLTLRSNGTFRYVGEKNVSRAGAFSGAISKHYFGDVFPTIAENYIVLRRSAFSTGKPTRAVTAVKIKVVRNGKTEELTNWCPGLDRDLFAFEMSVRGVVADATWKAEAKK